MFPPTAIKIREPIEPNGAIPINLQDQDSEIIDLFLHVVKAEGQLLDIACGIDDTCVTLTAGHGATAGDLICLKEGIAYYQAKVISVDVNELTLDTPLDFAYSLLANVCIGDANLNKNGSVSPVIAHLAPTAVSRWDVTRLIFHIEDNTDMDSARFGGISALTRGVVIRKKNDIYKNVFNIKCNGDFNIHNFDIEYDDKAPAGVYSLTSVRKFAGQENSGVVIRINGQTNDELQIIVQDDLTAVSRFEVLAQGHVVVDVPPIA
jgi:hypothetical protein